MITRVEPGWFVGFIAIVNDFLITYNQLGPYTVSLHESKNMKNIQK